MKLVTTKFKSGGLHEKHVVATWNLGNHLSICFWVQGIQEKPVSRWPVSGPSEYWLLASSPASKVKKKQCPHSTTNTHRTTTHTRQLQQYTRSTNNNYTKDNLKLAIKHTRQIRILQHVQKVKTPKQESTVYSYVWVHKQSRPSAGIHLSARGLTEVRSWKFGVFEVSDPAHGPRGLL